jgi:hypothetical protein
VGRRKSRSREKRKKRKRTQQQWMGTVMRRKGAL